MAKTRVLAALAAALLLLQLLLAAAAAAAQAQVQADGVRRRLFPPAAAAPMPHRSGARPNHYIVLLKDGVDVDAHLREVLGGADAAPRNLLHEMRMRLDRARRHVPGAAASLLTARVRPELVYKYQHALHGYALRCSDSFAATLRVRADVAAVEPDQYVHVEGAEQVAPPSWGLDRVDQRALPLDGVYRYPDHGGVGVDVYIIDTGIEITHPVRPFRPWPAPHRGLGGLKALSVSSWRGAHGWQDFGGRAIWGATFAAGSADADGNGHGTACAGVAAGSRYGVAKKYVRPPAQFVKSARARARRGR